MDASSPPDEVKIRLKHGSWEIEISCVASKVKEVVEKVLASVDSTFMPDSHIVDELSTLKKEIESLKAEISGNAFPFDQKFKHDSRRESRETGGTTCRGLLEALCYEGYFSLERSLGQVHEELSRRGYNYDRTAVSHSLTDMVRESILTRLGTMRNYRYIQKRPPGGSSTSINNALS